MSTEMRMALDDLTGAAARWTAGGLLVLDLALLGTVVLFDSNVDTGQLRVIALSVPVLGGLVLVWTVLLGDVARVLWLRCTGPGMRDPERARRARRLARRTVLLAVLASIWVLVGPQLILSSNTDSEHTAPPPTPAPTPRLVSPDLLS